MATKTNEWKDTTSYRRGDSDRSPREWTLRTGQVRVTVHRHIHDPGYWFVSCHDCGMQQERLSSKDGEAAKGEGLSAVRARLEAMLASMG